MKIFLVLILLSASVQLNATEQNPELDRFFNNYISSYADYLSADNDNKDILMITRHFYPKTLRVPPNSPPGVSKNRDELAAGFRFFVNGLKSKGAVKLRWQSIQYVNLGDRHALASNIAHVLDKDDRVIDVRSSVYSLYKNDLGWQIFMIQPIKPAQTPYIEARQL